MKFINYTTMNGISSSDAVQQLAKLLNAERLELACSH